MPASHPPFPVLGTLDGIVLAMPRLVVIVGPTEPMADQLFAFGDALLQSMWLTVVGKDYGVSAPATATSVHLTGAAVPATMDETALRDYVNTTIAANPSVTADGNTIYLFFYPPGTSHGDNCGDYGSHATLSTSKYAGKPTDALAWVQRCPLHPGQSEIDALTQVASHEFVESATDPFPRHGWTMPYQRWALTSDGHPPWQISSWSYFQGNAVEVGDLCNATNITESSFVYQRSWSTTAAAKGGDPCVPPSPEPYFSASPASDWVELPPGKTTNVPITGWSTEARGDWNVHLYWGDTFQAGYSATFPGGTHDTTLNNGTTAMLSVTTPDVPGAFEVFWLVSSDSPPDPKTGLIPQPPTGDREHVWIFGVRTTCPTCTPSTTCGNGSCDTLMNETCGNCPDDCGSCGAVCGASNSSVSCSTGSCPTHSTCQPGGGCSCDAGYASMGCDGSPCSGTSCSDPNWWCVPAACGMANFTTACSGGGSCPAASLCAPGNKCDCAPGSQMATCGGQPCPTSGCSYPDWYCTVCGDNVGPVACNGYTCPAFGVCGANQTCGCQPGYRAVNCGGAPCDGTNCPAGQWWCYAD
jgi:hypothetical protein